MVEVADEVWVKDVASRKPGPLPWTRALPVYQVLESPPTAAGPNQVLIGEGSTPIDEARRRTRWDLWRDWTLMDKLQL